MVVAAKEAAAVGPGRRATGSVGTEGMEAVGSPLPRHELEKQTAKQFIFLMGLGWFAGCHKPSQTTGFLVVYKWPLTL